MRRNEREEKEKKTEVRRGRGEEKGIEGGVCVCLCVYRGVRG